MTHALHRHHAVPHDVYMGPSLSAAGCCTRARACNRLQPCTCSRSAQHLFAMHEFAVTQHRHHQHAFTRERGCATCLYKRECVRDPLAWWCAFAGSLRGNRMAYLAYCVTRSLLCHHCMICSTVCGCVGCTRMLQATAATGV